MSGLTELKNEEFWSAPGRTKRETQKKLSKQKFRGVVLDAPERMPLDGRQKLPVIGWRVATFREAQQLSFEQFAVVTAVTQEGGETLAGRLYEPRIADPNRRKKGPTEDPGEGTTYKMFTVDLMERVGLPVVPDECVVTLLVQDQVSNRVEVALSKPVLAYSDPAVAAFLTERRASGALRSRQAQSVHPPASGKTSYRSEGGSPAVPAEPGIALAAPQSAKRGQPCMIRGSFRLPVPADLEVREDDDVGDGQAKAVLPVGLVLTGDKVPGPYVVQLQVPIYGAPDPETRLAEGFFALDVAEHVGLPVQTTFAYAFCGKAMAGPARFTLEEA